MDDNGFISIYIYWIIKDLLVFMDVFPEFPHSIYLRMPRFLSMAISGTDWLEVPIPYIFGLFFRPILMVRLRASFCIGSWVIHWFSCDIEVIEVINQLSYRTGASHCRFLQCEAPKIAFSWFITPITMVYGTYNYSYWGESKPTYNWGAPHCSRSGIFLVQSRVRGGSSEGCRSCEPVRWEAQRQILRGTPEGVYPAW